MVITVGSKYKIYVDTYYYKLVKSQKTKREMVCNKKVESDEVEIFLGYFNSIPSCLSEIVSDLKEQGHKMKDIVDQINEIYSSVIKTKHFDIKSKMKQKSLKMNIDGGYWFEIDERQFYLTEKKITKKKNAVDGDEFGEHETDIGFHNNLNRSINKIIHLELSRNESEINIRDLIPIIKENTEKYNNIFKSKIKEALRQGVEKC